MHAVTGARCVWTCAPLWDNISIGGHSALPRSTWLGPHGFLLLLIHGRNVWIAQGVWWSHCSWRSEEKAGAEAISEPVPVVALKKCVHILYLGRSRAFILIKVYCIDINICKLPLISAVMMHFYYIRVTWNCVLISWIPFSQLALEV